MAAASPAAVRPGQIYWHARYYRGPDGNWLPKFMVVLATTAGGDMVLRLLTSRGQGRPTDPRCFHGNPYPGYYLGNLGGALTAESWLDLRKQDDYDGTDFVKQLKDGTISLVMTLSNDRLCPALDCTAGADDTSVQQERLIRDQRALLGCT